jgi:hypothetical protein
VRAISEVLVAGDFYPDEPIASFPWPLLLQAGGFARLDGSRLDLTPKGRKALGQPAHEVSRGLSGGAGKGSPLRCGISPGAGKMSS